MFAIYRQAKIKSTAQLVAAVDHNGRHHQPPNADISKKSENEVEGPHRSEVVGRWREMVAGQKVRRNAVWAVELFCGMSPEAKDLVDPAKWFAEAKKFAAAEFGAANILHAALHLDEATPHAQIIVVPRRPKDGKLDASYFSDGKRALSQRQTRFAEQVGAQFGLKRGEEGSAAKHEPPAKWRESVEKEAEKVEVAPPPRLINRQKYAEDVEKRLKDEVRRRTAAEKETERVKADRDRAREKAKALASQVRQMDLLAVMQACGYSGEKQGREVVFNVEAGHVSINPEKQKFSCDWVTGKGGGGAIDLAMQVRGLKYAEAVAWLADLDPAAAVASARAHVIERTEAPSPPTPAEKYEVQAGPDPSRWESARRYLIERRAIPAEVVDQAHEAGLIHANRMGSVVFSHNLGERQGAEIHGVRGFKGFVGRKSAWYVSGDGGDHPAAVVESGIDALSLWALGHRGSLVSTGGCSLGPEVVAHLRVNEPSVAIAYDADAAGDAGYAREAENWPELRRWRPKAGKDWNDYLRMISSAAEGAKTISKRALDTLKNWKLHNGHNTARKRRSRSASASKPISGATMGI